MRSGIGDRPKRREDLRFLTEQSRYLDDLAQFYGRQGNSQRLARAMLTKLSNATMDDTFQSGLHEFIGTFIADNNRLGSAITEQYLT